MPIVYDLRRDIRFQQGKSEGRVLGKSEGFVLGIKKATSERNIAIVSNLLKNTRMPVKQIAKLVDVSDKFVIKIKNNLKKQG